MHGDNPKLTRALMLDTEADVLLSMALLIETIDDPKRASEAVRAVAVDCRRRARELHDEVAAENEQTLAELEERVRRHFGEGRVVPLVVLPSTGAHEQGYHRKPRLAQGHHVRRPAWYERAFGWAERKVGIR